MISRPTIIVLSLAALLSVGLPLTAQQTDSEVWTEKGQQRLPPGPHPLSWWTKDPLRLDSTGDLLINTPKGPFRYRGPFKPTDYAVTLRKTTLGTFSGHTVIELLFAIRAKSTISRQPLAGCAQWKFLLISAGEGQYIQFYGGQDDAGVALPFESAEVYGSGPDAIVGTYDRVRGNGGECWDGYWWFDRKGAHAVDFAPLERSIRSKAPPNSTYTLRCWAIDPHDQKIETEAQAKDAECHGCGILGKITADYRIHNGIAYAVNVEFSPEQEP